MVLISLQAGLLLELAVGASSRATSPRSESRSFASLSRSSWASSVSPNQPNRSRTGLTALLAPSWIGARTSSAPRWVACSPPLEDSPK